MVLVAAAAPCLESSAAAAVALVGVTVIDVEAGVAVPQQTIVVAGERIVAMGPTPDVTVPAEALLVDASHLFAMPGLFDAHVHFVDPPLYGILSVANGVTCVRDMGMSTEDIIRARGQFESGELLGPQMVVTGILLDGVPPLLPSISRGVLTPSDGRAAVRELAAAGVDMIKVYSRLSSATFFAIVDEAHGRGLKVVGHVPDTVTIEAAAAAGLDSSEHDLGFDKLMGRLLGEPVRPYYVSMGIDAPYFARQDEVDPGLLAASLAGLRDAGLTVCPTVVTLRDALTPGAYQEGRFAYSNYVSETMRAAWDVIWGDSGSGSGEAPAWEPWARFVVRLHAAGIPLMIGTDASVPGLMPGFSVAAEMEIWQEAGLPAADVLRGATLVPAHFMGFSEDLGRLLPGMVASLVLLRANPLDDVGAVRQIESVFLRGKHFDRAALDALLREAQALAGCQAAAP